MDNKNYNSASYKYVDLGLPSGTLWCEINLGARSKYDVGGHYQWGGIENICENAAYTYYKDNDNTIYYKLSYKQYNNVPAAKLTRDIVPGGEYDTVTQLLGTKWQMPTELQFKELFDDNYVKKEWKDNYDGTSASGLLITSNTNGNSIFLPTTGYIAEDYSTITPQTTYIDYIKEYPDQPVDFKLNYQNTGTYWSTFIDTRDYIFASNLYFWQATDGTINFTIDSDSSSDIRWRGYSIRPVYYRSKIVSNEISTDEKNIQKTIGNLYGCFLDNKNFSINKINTIYDEETPSYNITSNNINNVILGRLMKTNDNNYESNIDTCSNSLLFYKYKYKQNGQESNKYYTGINLYYCDNKGLCFPVVQNMYIEESADNDQNNQENQNTPVVSDIKVIAKYDVTDSSSPIMLYNSSYGSYNFASMKVDNGEEMTLTSSYTFTGDTEPIVEFTLANGVTSINQNVFMNCTSLKEITIPDSITSIGQQAFSGCLSLESITIGNSVKSIGNYAFDSCLRLTSINIPNSVTSIGNYTFNSCSGLTSIIIPNSVTSIGNWTFHNCSSLKSITIGNLVREIGEHAFDRCSSLTSITCNRTTAPSISKNTFQDIAGEGTLIISTDAIYETIRNESDEIITYGYDQWMSEENYYLGKYDWYIIKVEKRIIAKYDVTDSSNAIELYNSSYDSSNFVSMKVDDIVGEFNPTSSYEFDSGKHTVKFTLADAVTSIDMGAFSGCSTLKEIIIADHITSIGDYAFSDCPSLESITIGNSVTKIGRKAFQDCSSLTSITCNAINAPDIESNTFENVAQCGVLNVPTEAEGYDNWLILENYYLGAYDWNNAKKRVIATYNVTSTEEPTTLFYITPSGSDSGQGLGSDEVITPIFSSMEVDGEEVELKSSYKFIETGDHIVKFTLKDNVTSIGKKAFKGCSKLTNIIIPNLIKSIGESAFYSCSGLTNITIPNSVESIGSNAFFNCSGLTSITIPDSVISIDEAAFVGCSGLTSLIVENENTKFDSRDNCNAIIETSTNKLIAGCKNTIIHNSVTSIGNWAFAGCSELTSITIPNLITSIGNGAFMNCTALEEINIPNSITLIGEAAFAGCSELININIPISVTSIGEAAFTGSGLTNITIPLYVTAIDKDTFKSCSSLTSIIIPNYVTSIGENAFMNCTALTSITCNARIAPEITDNTFQGINSNGTLTIPTDAIYETIRESDEIITYGYDQWMREENYYLGYYNWNKVAQ